MADIDIKVEICEASSWTESKETTSNHTVEAGDNRETDDVSGNKLQDSIISSYRISDENAFEPASNVSKHKSNIIFQGKARLCDTGKQSSGKRMTVSEVSGESEKMSVKDKSSDTYTVVIGEGTNGNESSETWMTRLSKDGVDKLDSVAAVFDLNEDINEDGTDGFIQPDVETLSSCSVIKVVAKAGIPRGLPTMPLKFEGGHNWKGSAEMSAFRSVALSNMFPSEPCSRKRYSSRGFTGIDLNVAAVEEQSSTLQEHFCSDVGSKRAKSLGNDLNFLHGEANGLNMNAYTCKAVTYKNFQWLGQDHEPLGNKTSDHSTNPGNREIDFISHTSLKDSSTMRQEQDTNLAHSEQYLVAASNVLQPMELLQRVAPWQPKLPYISCTLPPQNHFLKVPFSQNHVPYSYHFQEHGNLVQIINGPNTRNRTTSISTVDAKAVRSIPTSGIRMVEAAPLMFLTGNLTDEHSKSINQENWYATLTKSKEPEGGINYYQLGYRQDI
ncbi:uncharacterized protein [Primulina eburnea]|uniref:uncharacterized protein isoform X1 n=1 Tax=Primulina eburnea TaxID=1245227 RepID=UPI003C6BEB97